MVPLPKPGAISFHAPLLIAQVNGRLYEEGEKQNLKQLDINKEKTLLLVYNLKQTALYLFISHFVGVC
jgi:hypothetical protein